MRDGLGCISTTRRWLLHRVAILFCLLVSISSGQQGEPIFNGTTTTNATNSTEPAEIAWFDTTHATLSGEYCEDVDAGDILVFVVETNGPVGTIVGLLALTDLPAGLELHLTDRPWNGTHFLQGRSETDLQLTVPPEGITALQRFGHGNFSFQEQWSDPQGNTNETLNLNHTEGDSLFLYCYEEDGIIRPILGFSNAGSWAEPGLTAYGQSFSALPDDLAEVGAVVLPHFDNYEYVGPNVGRKAQLQQFMTDPDNWNGTDQSFFDVEVITVVIENTTTLTWSTNRPSPTNPPASDPDAEDDLEMTGTLPPLPEDVPAATSGTWRQISSGSYWQVLLLVTCVTVRWL